MLLANGLFLLIATVLVVRAYPKTELGQLKYDLINKTSANPIDPAYIHLYTTTFKPPRIVKEESNGELNKVIISHPSTIQTEVNKSNFSTTPQVNNLNCPTHLFECKSKASILTKYNSLYKKSESQQQVNKFEFICIDRNRLCDKIRDCPLGEDESNQNCPLAHSGCYLCRGTYDKCIAITSLCDNQIDCPNKDDESNQICDGKYLNKMNKVVDNSIGSTFPFNKVGDANVYIVNQKREKQNLSDLDANSNDIKKQQLSVNSAEFPVSKPENISQHQSVGFMFKVENFVIYNSEVKMFNQDSENIGSSRPENQNQRRQMYQNESLRQALDNSNKTIEAI